ncbi:MAG: 50S ribosomal protein L11 [Candidatus Micrarchaeota archaeon]
MSEKIIDTIVDGGKATAGPPLGPALGPLGVPAPKVIADINTATKAFEGMKVPVKVIVETSTKTYRIEVGTPPIAELVKKAAGVEKGSGTKEVKAGNITFEKIKEIATNASKSLGKDLKQKVKEIAGTCVSMGISVDGKGAKDFIKAVDEGKYSF